MKYLTPILIVLLFLFSYGCGNENSESKKEVRKAKPEPVYLYGICIDSLDVVEGKVQKNEFLANILQREGVSYNTVNYIDRNKRDVFDVRKIKVGNKYVFLKTRDSIPTAKYWIYEIDRTNYAVFQLTDSLSAWKGEKEVITKVEHVGVEIKSSLWNAMAEAGCDASLILELSDIYAWTIDFFGIQQGDSCKVIFEEKYICGDTVPFGIGNVLAAYFKNNGDGKYAFSYEQNGRKEYFDENGDNLRKAFLKAPLNYRRISSKFSEARMHPVHKIVRPHHGVDYAAPSGTPVQSIGDGTVIDKGWDKKGGGNYLKIKHNSTYTTTYMHLKGFAKGISKGCKVKQGQTIGYVGMTGTATGPHLDFRLQKNGTYIDPLKFKSPSAEPVKKENLEAYKKDIEVLMGILKEH
ncbi:MAG: peptidoglycan DD-metalloendopeptidase family protein [Bacteroidales bacterium]|nr:peptidoglycan DD-metalloendopeptidase family protein [Bacteroidales bacterium]